MARHRPGIGSLLLAVALIPSLRSEDKPALTTSLLTASCLAVFAVVYASLELWYSTTTTSLTSFSGSSSRTRGCGAFDGRWSPAELSTKEGGAGPSVPGTRRR